MKKQELLQAVYARIGGKPDFAPEPLILAKVQEAIKAVTKELVYSGNPMASLLIDSTGAVDPLEFDDDLELYSYNVIQPNGPDFLKLTNKFLLVTWLGRYDEKQETIENCNSWDALETLPKLHNKPYYKWHNNKLYVAFPEPPVDEEEDNTPALQVEHYAYLPLSEFPYELIDLLLNVLIPMILPTPPAEPPKKNAK
jgi:hypothetical protein